MEFASILALWLKKNKADLVGGKVPASQLPSYISDAIEVATYDDLPQPGQSGVTYVALDTGSTYRWTGTIYINVSESNHHVSVKVDRNALSTMGALETYINNINAQGLHVFFDLSEYIPNTYICTVLLFQKDNVKYATIFDIINGRTYMAYDGYAANETVANYLSRTGDDLIRTVRLDPETTIGQVNDLLNQVNAVGHHVMFDVSNISANAYLCTILIADNQVVITDVVSGKVARVYYDSSKLVSAALEELSEIAIIKLTELSDGSYSLDLE